MTQGYSTLTVDVFQLEIQGVLWKTIFMKKLRGPENGIFVAFFSTSNLFITILFLQKMRV